MTQRSRPFPTQLVEIEAKIQQLDGLQELRGLQQVSVPTKRLIGSQGVPHQLRQANIKNPCLLQTVIEGMTKTVEVHLLLLKILRS